MKYKRRLLWASALLLGISTFGCGTMTTGRGWGQDATLTPGWGRVGRAALNAVKAPATWAPAAAAIAFRAGDIDRNITERAARNTPVFGSTRNAEQMSDNFLTAADVVWAISAIATPSGETFRESAINKTKGIGVQAGAGMVLRGTIGFIKTATDITAPNGFDKDGLPSGHVTMAAFFTTLTSRNIETLGLSGSAETAFDIGLGGLAAATAWARIEANQHFPSEVLTSIALGHFFGAFITDAFLGIDNPRNVVVLFEPSREGTVALVRISF